MRKYIAGKEPGARASKFNQLEVSFFEIHLLLHISQLLEQSDTCSPDLNLPQVVAYSDSLKCFWAAGQRLTKGGTAKRSQAPPLPSLVK
jgi:hypothetical protein